MRKLVFPAFAAIVSTLSLPFRYASAVAANVRRRFDPFDNTGLATSRVRKQYHRFSTSLAMGLALVAIALLPAMAMPVFSAKTGVTSVVVLHKLGATGLLAAGAAQAPPPKQAFRYGTDRRRLTIGTFNFVPGQAVPTITLPQVGMASRILVNIAGTYTKANATGTNLLDGYDALLSRATIKVNNGAGQILDVSGVGTSIVNKDLSPSLPIKRGLITTAGAQTFAYKFMLPINANNREQFTIGLLNLQAPEIRCTLDLVAGPLANVFATVADVTVFTATATVSYEWFSIPDLTKFALPPLTLVRTIEEAPVAIAAVGLQPFQVPRLGTMFDYHAVLVLNNVYANVLTNFTNFAWRYNMSDTQYDVQVADWETYEAELYGAGSGSTTFLDPHAISFNLWAAGNRPWNGGDFRDAIDTEENTTTQSMITVAAGTALNAGKDNIFHVRRVLQRIVQAPSPS